MEQEKTVEEILNVFTNKVITLALEAHIGKVPSAIDYHCTGLNIISETEKQLEAHYKKKYEMKAEELAEELSTYLKNICHGRFQEKFDSGFFYCLALDFASHINKEREK